MRNPTSPNHRSTSIEERHSGINNRNLPKKGKRFNQWIAVILGIANLWSLLKMLLAFSYLLIARTAAGCTSRTPTTGENFIPLMGLCTAEGEFLHSEKTQWKEDWLAESTKPRKIGFSSKKKPVF